MDITKNLIINKDIKKLNQKNMCIVIKIHKSVWKKIDVNRDIWEFDAKYVTITKDIIKIL